MFVNIHTHTFTNTKDTIEIVQHSYSNPTQLNTLHSVGIHPWNSHDISPEKCVDFLHFATRNPQACFIGECGIDRACSVSLYEQMPIFEACVQFAQKNQYPLLIHCVRAYSDVLSILKQNKVTVPVIFHDFRGNSQQVKQLSAFQSFFSFGVSLTTSQKFQEVFCDIPLSQIFLETDVADFSIASMYKNASHIQTISIDFLIEQIMINFERVIGNKANR